MNVPTYNAVSRPAGAPPGTRWDLNDVHLSRPSAIASMIRRAMDTDVWYEAERFLARILAGTADPEQPHLLGHPDYPGRQWICVCRDDRTPPEPVDPDAGIPRIDPADDEPWVETPARQPDGWFVGGPFDGHPYAGDGRSTQHLPSGTYVRADGEPVVYQWHPL